jgi:hypothetical protein
MRGSVVVLGAEARSLSSLSTRLGADVFNRRYIQSPIHRENRFNPFVESIGFRLFPNCQGFR